MDATAWERFWPKVRRTDGCWEWTGALSDGYGHFSVGRKAKPAHKVLYQHEVGPVPAGLVLDHLCLNRACVRPDHLEVTTNRSNLMRGQSLAAENAALTHCRRGHEFNPVNTRYAQGRRSCRVCFNARQQRRRALERP